MRRDEREISDKSRIIDVLNRCDTIRLGMNGGGYPYVIPMTFGCEMVGDEIIIYFHSAGGGRKWDILNADPRVCVEADLYYQVKRLEGGDITAVYESVIGTGDAERITDQTEKVRILKNILGHYKEGGFPVTSCSGLQKVEVFRVVLKEVCGKANL